MSAPDTETASCVVGQDDSSEDPMLETAQDAGRASRAFAYVSRHPWRTVAWLLPLGVGLMLAIDLALGSNAEYYNAVHLVEAWLEVLTGGSGSDAPAFIMNQTDLGSHLAMAIGTGLLVVEPAVGLALLVLPVSLVSRRLSR